MNVNPATAEHRRQHQGQIYHFCSEHCARKFAAAPDDYPKGKQPKAKEAAEDAIYTCPKHPEIEQVGPGFCPICGMALEPKTCRSQTRGQARSCAI